MGRKALTDKSDTTKKTTTKKKTTKKKTTKTTKKKTVTKPKIEWPEYIKNQVAVITPYIDDLKSIMQTYMEDKTLSKESWTYIKQRLIEVCEQNDPSELFNVFLVSKLPEKYSSVKRTTRSIVVTNEHCKYFLNTVQKYKNYTDDNEDYRISLVHNLSCHLYYFIRAYSEK